MRKREPSLGMQGLKAGIVVAATNRDRDELLRTSLPGERRLEWLELVGAVRRGIL